MKNLTFLSKSDYIKVFILPFWCFVSLSCSKSENYDVNCNYLLNVGILTSLNLNLAQYNQLNFTSNPVYVPNEGNGGLFVNNTGTGYVAFDAADPNIPFGECSILIIEGIEAVSSVECQVINRYNLITGQPMQNPELRCSLKPYFIERIGSELFISN
jgi:hypothetical protein